MKICPRIKTWSKRWRRFDPAVSDAFDDDDNDAFDGMKDYIIARHSKVKAVILEGGSQGEEDLILPSLMLLKTMLMMLLME